VDLKNIYFIHLHDVSFSFMLRPTLTDCARLIVIVQCPCNSLTVTASL